MSNRALVLAASIGASVAGGCASLSTTGSAWKETGYRQDVFGYEVRYRDANAKAMTSADWQLDNYHIEPGGDSWEEKTGNDYMATRRLDWDQNGEVSEMFEVNKEAIFDLRITNKKNNGVIWTKAHPLLPEQAERQLEVILDNYIDSLSSQGLYAVGNLFGANTQQIRNFTTFTVPKEIIKVGVGDALTATVELGEVERLKLDPRSRSGMLKIVMMKIRCLTPSNCRLGSGGGGGTPEVAAGTGTAADLSRWPEVDCRGRRCQARTGLLVIGYYNTPPYFAAGLPELDDLLTRISFPDAMPLPVNGTLAADKQAPAPQSGQAPPPNAGWRPAQTATPVRAPGGAD